MPRIQRQLILLAGFCIIALITTFGFTSHQDDPYELSLHRFSIPWASSSVSSQPEPLGFGFIHRTYVISLAHRYDRKVDIDRLMSTLEMPNWHYHNGTYANTPLIENFMRKAQAQRVKAEKSPDEWVGLPFEWPYDSLSNYTSPISLYATPLPPAGAELWPEDLSHNKDELKPMMCATENFKVQKYKEGEIQWRYLTPQRVATFHSHMSAVRKIVDENARLGVEVNQWPNRTQSHISLVLEDDVDIESDIQKRMEVIIPLLPFNWDLLFLGYCWSEEDHYKAIVGEYTRPSKNQLHPSHTPRCLHAYALSPAGALKLLTHLRHVQFAYGRAVDEAFEWLVSEKRAQAFTIVPPLIIQRKVTKTDISLAGNDLWRESLDHGILGTTLNGEEV